ncbi:predicted protein [Botrytis cinerea T4]|uniref:Uncharacterized protein n=1 Tax=Botryotinia fuckeliana (strain T4) TaxID=999810 RepID=G2YEE2_BOTF4|nr:predicted protein [Botrytis cinerea T4]
MDSELLLLVLHPGDNSIIPSKNKTGMQSRAAPFDSIGFPYPSPLFQ